MTRLLLTACCVLFPAWVMSAVPVLRARPPAAECPAVPVECQVNPPTFNFGRAEMSPDAPPIQSNATISVTCTQREEGYDVDVFFQLKALPPAPARQMRDRIGGAYLRYDMFVDAGRTRYWGDGESHGTAVFEGELFLNDRNRVGTLAFLLYGRVDGAQSLIPPGQFLGAVVTRVDYEFACQPQRRGGRPGFFRR
jgi:spore coat protein U-like protein